MKLFKLLNVIDCNQAVISVSGKCVYSGEADLYPGKENLDVENIYAEDDFVVVECSED